MPLNSIHHDEYLHQCHFLPSFSYFASDSASELSIVAVTPVLAEAVIIFIDATLAIALVMLRILIKFVGLC